MIEIEFYGENETMKITNKIISKIKNQRGATAVVVAVVLAMLIGFLALAIDVGYLYATKNELQNVSDSAALAATGLLGQIYSGMTYQDQQSYDCSINDTILSDSYSNDCLSIIAKAQDVVGSGKNKAGGKNINIDSGDIFINKWTGTQFGTNNYLSPDAVRVIARRDGSANGPITTFFAKILGIYSANVNADATAALTGPDLVGPGEMRLPIGISENQFYDDYGNESSGVCSRLIQFSPTNDSCAGWHNFFASTHSASAITTNLFTFIAEHPYDVDPADGNPDEPCALEPCGKSTTPDWFDTFFPDYGKNPGGDITGLTKSADFYNFNNGTVAALFNGAWIDWPDRGDQSSWTGGWMDKNGNPIAQNKTANPAPFPALFDYFRFRDNESIPDGGYLIDPDGIENSGDEITDPDLVWTTTAPIYRDPSGVWDDCQPPNNQEEIVGFATVHVLMPNAPPDNTVKVLVECDMTVIDARGGGVTIGNLKGTIPNLVE